MTLRNIRLIVEYDGTAYSGWQRQANVPTIQGELDRALTRISGHAVDLRVAGRTDAGVHALGQVCNFRTASRLPVKEIARIANQLLPGDIRVVEARRVRDRFHSTFDAHSKIYRYVIRNVADKNVFERLYHHVVRPKLDLKAMRRAALKLKGTHDFNAFKGPLAKAVNTHRTLLSVKILRKKEKVLIEFHGKSFLHQMVRILAGTLVYVGLGKIRPEEIPDIIASRERRRAGPTLPPQGLFLVRVFYPRRRPRHDEGPVEEGIE